MNKKINCSKIYCFLGVKIALMNRMIYSLLCAPRFKEVGDKFRIEPFANIKGGQYISIGNNVRMMRGLRLQAYDSYNNQRFNPHIRIGSYFNCGENVHIGAINEIVIGDNVLFGSRIYVTDHQHGNISESEKKVEPLKRNLHSRGPVIIGDKVFVGEGVVILPGVTIGDGAIIGANAVVTQDIPSYSVAAGIPARVIKNL